MSSKSFTSDRLTVQVHPNEQAMGAAAAADAGRAIRDAVGTRGHARIVLATGNSQYAFTAALVEEDVPWHAVTVFHMDEYVGVDRDHPASFQRWIRERIEDRVRPGLVEYISGDGSGEDEAARYEALLRSEPLDLVCMGIGENGHLAFNEPFDADFDDSRWVRVIALSEGSRLQQVGEGHFPAPEDVPANAVSLTIPALLSARKVQVCAPEQRKAEAVRATLYDQISTAVPSTVLRKASHATLYLEPDSSSSLAVPA